MGLGPVAQVELPARFGGGHIDPRLSQPSDMLIPTLGVDDMERPIPALEALLDEREEDSILLVTVAKERTHVAARVDYGSAEPHLERVTIH